MINHFKNAFIQLAFIVSMIIVASCNNTSTPDDSKEVAEDKNKAMFNTKKQEKDAQFLVNAAEINLAEIQLGKLAQQNGKSTQVKELGKMMVVAHSQLLNELTALAKSKMITVPTTLTEDAQETYQSLNKKSGNDFDKAYTDKIVSEHNDAVDVFEKASTDCNDTDIKKWASTTLTSLRTHQMHSIDCQQALTNK